MYYKAVLEQDGTYSIRSSVAGANYNNVEHSGVRGCNVERVLRRLRSQDFFNELAANAARVLPREKRSRR